jgi:hypothetical protein
MDYFETDMPKQPISSKLIQNHGLENFHGNGERFVLKLTQNEECVGNFQITANDHII